MNTAKRGNWKSGIAAVAVLALCLATVTFGQSQGGPAGKGSQAAGKMEPDLPARASKAKEMGQLLPAIVQFTDDTLGDDERNHIIQGARGKLKQHYSTLASASVDPVRQP